jgi:sirohydrochlorin ferrochelatase
MKTNHKDAIILLGHGSRIPGAGEGMERVAEGMRKKLKGCMVEVCYMSKLGPHFPEIFDRCAAGGATRVIVMPYFLHAGLHILEDIPEILRKKAKDHPTIEMILGHHLGFDDCLVDLVIRRTDESRKLPDIRCVKTIKEEQTD